MIFGGVGVAHTTKNHYMNTTTQKGIYKPFQSAHSQLQARIAMLNVYVAESIITDFIYIK
jgi:hypothetical protein